MSVAFDSKGVFYDYTYRQQMPNMGDVVSEDEFGSMRHMTAGGPSVEFSGGRAIDTHVLGVRSIRPGPDGLYILQTLAGFSVIRRIDKLTGAISTLLDSTFLPYGQQIGATIRGMAVSGNGDKLFIAVNAPWGGVVLQYAIPSSGK